MFGGSAAQDTGSGLGWPAVTMATVCYGDESPITFAGKVVGLIWMFAGIIIISGLTEAIASSLTVSKLSSNVRGVGDLYSAKVATVPNSTNL